MNKMVRRLAEPRSRGALAPGGSPGHSAMNAACPQTMLPDYDQLTSIHSGSNHRRVDRGSPGCQWGLPTMTDFVIP